MQLKLNAVEEIEVYFILRCVKKKYWSSKVVHFARTFTIIVMEFFVYHLDKMPTQGGC